MYLLKFTDCVISKGRNYSLIIDLNRNYHIKFSNSAIEYLETILNLPYDKSSIDNSFKELIDFLLESEILFLAESPDNFPEINFKDWDYYSHITNAIVNCKPTLYAKVFEILEDLLCYNLIIDFQLDDSNIEDYLHILEKSLHNKTFDGIDLYIDLRRPINQSELDFLLNYINNNPVVYNIFLINNQFEKIHYRNNAETRVIKSIIKSYHPSNKIHINPNLNTYIESFKHNVYFNRKLFIGPLGEVKSSQESAFVFKTIDSNTSSKEILDVVASREFKKKWFITKDRIINCIECPYKRICVDSDQLVSVKKNLFERTEKCEYEFQI